VKLDYYHTYVMGLSWRDLVFALLWLASWTIPIVALYFSGEIQDETLRGLFALVVAVMVVTFPGSIFTIWYVGRRLRRFDNESGSLPHKR